MTYWSMQYVHFKPSRKERIRGWCDDAIRAIDAIASFIAGTNFEAYATDLKTTSAVERQLLVVAEVLARMPEFDEAYAQAHKIRGLGNRLRHDYERVDHRVIWDAVSGPALAELRAELVAFCPK
jgi:uncharacterized protein with HEPN domain